MKEKQKQKKIPKMASKQTKTHKNIKRRSSNNNILKSKDDIETKRKLLIKEINNLG